MADAAFTALLTHTCSISRRTQAGAADALGAIPETIGVVTASVPCLIQQMEETIEFTRRGKQLKTRLCAFFEITANLLEDDIITWGGKKYEVISVDDAGGQGHHYEAYLWNLEN